MRIDRRRRADPPQSARLLVRPFKTRLGRRHPDAPLLVPHHCQDPVRVRRALGLPDLPFIAGQFQDADPVHGPDPVARARLLENRPHHFRDQTLGFGPRLPLAIALPARQPATVGRHPDIALAILVHRAHHVGRQPVAPPDVAPLLTRQHRQPGSRHQPPRRIDKQRAALGRSAQPAVAPHPAPLFRRQLHQRPRSAPIQPAALVLGERRPFVGRHALRRAVAPHRVPVPAADLPPAAKPHLVLGKHLHRQARPRPDPAPVARAARHQARRRGHVHPAAGVAVDRLPAPDLFHACDRHCLEVRAPLHVQSLGRAHPQRPVAAAMQPPRPVFGQPQAVSAALEFVAVVAEQPALGRHPQEALAILHDAFDAQVPQPAFEAEYFEIGVIIDVLRRCAQRPRHEQYNGVTGAYTHARRNLTRARETRDSSFLSLENRLS